MKRIMVAWTESGGRPFRVNVGRGWTGDSIERMPDGAILIVNPRPFATGVPPGYPDLSGWDANGQCVFMEVKLPGGRLSKHQRQFINRANDAGCKAGVVRSVQDALRLLNSG